MLSPQDAATGSLAQAAGSMIAQVLGCMQSSGAKVKQHALRALRCVAQGDPAVLADDRVRSAVGACFADAGRSVRAEALAVVGDCVQSEALAAQAATPTSATAAGSSTAGLISQDGAETDSTCSTLRAYLSQILARLGDDGVSVRRAAVAILRESLAEGALSAGVLSQLQALADAGDTMAASQAADGRGRRLRALQALMRLAADDEEEESVHADVAGTFDAIWGAPPSKEAAAVVVYASHAANRRGTGKGDRRRRSSGYGTQPGTAIATPAALAAIGEVDARAAEITAVAARCLRQCGSRSIGDSADLGWLRSSVHRLVQRAVLEGPPRTGAGSGAPVTSPQTIQAGGMGTGSTTPGSNSTLYQSRGARSLEARQAARATGVASEMTLDDATGDVSSGRSAADEDDEAATAEAAGEAGPNGTGLDSAWSQASSLASSLVRWLHALRSGASRARPADASEIAAASSEIAQLRRAQRRQVVLAAEAAGREIPAEAPSQDYSMEGLSLWRWEQAGGAAAALELLAQAEPRLVLPHIRSLLGLLRAPAVKDESEDGDAPALSPPDGWRSLMWRLQHRACLALSTLLPAWTPPAREVLAGCVLEVHSLLHGSMQPALMEAAAAMLGAAVRASDACPAEYPASAAAARALLGIESPADDATDGAPAGGFEADIVNGDVGSDAVPPSPVAAAAGAARSDATSRSLRGWARAMLAQWWRTLQEARAAEELLRKRNLGALQKAAQGQGGALRRRQILSEVRRMWVKGLRSRVAMHRGVQVALYGVGLLCRFVRFDLPDDGPGFAPSATHGLSIPTASLTPSKAAAASGQSVGAGSRLASRLGFGDGGETTADEDPIGDDMDDVDDDDAATGVDRPQLTVIRSAAGSTVGGDEMAEGDGPAGGSPRSRAFGGAGYGDPLDGPPLAGLANAPVDLALRPSSSHEAVGAMLLSWAAVPDPTIQARCLRGILFLGAQSPRAVLAPAAERLIEHAATHRDPALRRSVLVGFLELLRAHDERAKEGLASRGAVTEDVNHDGGSASSGSPVRGNTHAAVMSLGDRDVSVLLGCVQRHLPLLRGMLFDSKHAVRQAALDLVDEALSQGVAGPEEAASPLCALSFVLPPPPLSALAEATGNAPQSEQQQQTAHLMMQRRGQEWQIALRRQRRARTQASKICARITQKHPHAVWNGLARGVVDGFAMQMLHAGATTASEPSVPVSAGSSTPTGLGLPPSPAPVELEAFFAALTLQGEADRAVQQAQSSTAALGESAQDSPEAAMHRRLNAIAASSTAGEQASRAARPSLTMSLWQECLRHGAPRLRDASVRGLLSLLDSKAVPCPAVSALERVSQHLALPAGQAQALAEARASRHRRSFLRFVGEAVASLPLDTEEAVLMALRAATERLARRGELAPRALLRLVKAEADAKGIELPARGVEDEADDEEGDDAQAHGNAVSVDTNTMAAGSHDVVYGAGAGDDNKEANKDENKDEDGDKDEDAGVSSLVREELMRSDTLGSPPSGPKSALVGAARTGEGYDFGMAVPVLVVGSDVTCRKAWDLVLECAELCVLARIRDTIRRAYDLSSKKIEGFVPPRGGRGARGPANASSETPRIRGGGSLPSFVTALAIAAEELPPCVDAAGNVGSPHQTREYQEVGPETERGSSSSSSSLFPPLDQAARLARACLRLARAEGTLDLPMPVQGSNGAATASAKKSAGRTAATTRASRSGRGKGKGRTRDSGAVSRGKGRGRGGSSRAKRRAGTLADSDEDGDDDGEEEEVMFLEGGGDYTGVGAGVGRRSSRPKRGAAARAEARVREVALAADTSMSVPMELLE